jgi:isocitrate dehydrogenase (NAD+)
VTRVALIVGEGISREIAPPVLDVVAASGARVEWDRVDVPTLHAGAMGPHLDQAVAAVERCGVGLKTRLLVPPPASSIALGDGVLGSLGDAPGPQNPNVLLRRRLGLFAGVIPIRPLAGIRTRFPGIDLLVIREITEDIYKGIEHEIVPGVVESLKVVTREACERITRFAYATLRAEGRRHLTFVHKANIMKMSDGLFLATVRRVAAENPDIGYKESIVDAVCMQLVLDPYPFDVLLMGNHYGDILSNLGSGLAGGISGAHAISIGDRYRMYEAIHGEAPHLEGTGRANPLPLLSPAIALLRHLGETVAADRIAAAVERVLEAGETLTPDLGGSATAREMAEAIIAAMRSDPRPAMPSTAASA